MMKILTLITVLVFSCIVFMVFYHFGVKKAKESLPMAKCAKNSASETIILAEPNYSTQFLFHKNTKKSINKHVFNSIYHTRTQVKAEVIVTTLSSWINETTNSIKCNRIYRTVSGSRSNQPPKCVALVSVPDGYQSPSFHLHRKGSMGNLRDQFMNDYTRRKNRKEADTALPGFLSEIRALKDSFIDVVGSPFETTAKERNRRTLVVMVANSGVFNLLLNFMCSCHSSGIDTKPIVVFVGEASHVSVVKNMGATPVFLPGIGEMPKKVAGNYGDKVFGKMMWLKVTSVFIANYAGFNVLFQDTDLVWFKNPIPYFDQHPVDSSFMDDGARSPRFSPYFSNSGFYYLKHNERTRYLMHRMMLSMSEISYTHSHQGTLIKYLIEGHDLVDLQISVLDQISFPSGKMFHHNKTYMKQLKAGKISPYVFHMCWTANSEDKIKNFMSIKKWYVAKTEGCSKPGSAHIHTLVESCCMAPE